MKEISSIIGTGLGLAIVILALGAPTVLALAGLAALGRMLGL